MIEFGVASTCVNQPESLRYSVEWAIEHGFQGVEFNAPEMYLAEQSLVDLKWAFDMSVDHNLRYTHHFPPGALPGSHVAVARERDLEEFSKEIYVAGELGVALLLQVQQLFHRQLGRRVGGGGRDDARFVAQGDLAGRHQLLHVSDPLLFH